MELQTLKNKYQIIGRNPDLHFALEVSLQAAKTDLSVLINGESGVGKEVFSKIIHTNSKRKHNSFIAINCGALPEGTINSELFGHEKGSFTGATDARKGYFETTNEGTIFLDEIGEMPLNTQARLLRVLESGEYIRVGSSEVKKTNVRIIAATNKNLLQLIDAGKFREDLYYRLSTIPIRVPALRDRHEDILLLFRFFANQFAEKYHAEPIQLSEEAKEKLMSYRFPGNIRELKNIAERLAVFSEHKKNIELEDLIKMADMQDYHATPVMYQGNATVPLHTNNDMILKMFFDLKKEVYDMKNGILQLMNSGNIDPQIFNSNDVHNNNSNGVNNISPISFHPPVKKEVNALVEESLNLAEKEKELIIKSLQKNYGKREKVAKELGISSRTLFRRLKEYDIDDKIYKRTKKQREEAKYHNLVDED